MELKEFIETTIMQLVEGINTANKEVQKHGAYINPRCVNRLNEIAKINNNDYPISNIDFEVSLIQLNSEEKKKGIGVNLKGFNFDNNGKNSQNQQSATSIKFSIPIIFPTTDGNNNSDDIVKKMNGKIVKCQKCGQNYKIEKTKWSYINLKLIKNYILNILKNQ
jgi:hypothetical protein